MTVKDAVSKFLGSECLVENISSDKLQKAVDYIAQNKICQDKFLKNCGVIFLFMLY